MMDPDAAAALMKGDWARRDLATLAIAMRERGYPEWAKYVEEALQRLHAERSVLEPRKP